MVSIYEYIARNNPEEAYALICQYASPSGMDSRSIERDLQVLTNQKGESFLINKITSIHPDKILFDSRKKGSSLNAESSSNVSSSGKNIISKNFDANKAVMIGSITLIAVVLLYGLTKK